MNKKFFRLMLIKVSTVFVLCILLTTQISAQELDEYGPILFEKFKNATKKELCGGREEMFLLGEQIIKEYAADPQNQDVVAYVKKKMAEAKEKERTCARSNTYDTLYKTKFWQPFFEVSKQIINEEGDNPLALDVLLTLVSVGYDRPTVEDDNFYAANTIYYAKLAIHRIESGQTSKTGKWGFFEPFYTRENALSWTNYIIGSLMSYNLKQKKEALVFLYKSTQYETDNQQIWNAFSAMGSYYFDEAARLDEQYREKLKASNYQENDETKAILALARGTADRAIDAYGRAYKLAVEKKVRKDVTDRLYKTMTDLYKFRFNIKPDKNAPDMDVYFENLISRPMPDPTTPVEPVSDNSIKIRLQ